MKKKFSAFKAISLTFIVLILCLGINLFNSQSDSNNQNSEVMHTYLIKVPLDAGICPYALASKSHGKLHMINNSECTCPFSENASYMTTKCRNIKSVLELLPSSIQKKVEIRVIDNKTNENKPKSLDNQVHIAGL
jgi:hypothetical protein